jgi:DNA-binding NarL/FixJ family response regulator
MTATARARLEITAPPDANSVEAKANSEASPPAHIVVGMGTSALEAGREAFERRAWTEAVDQLTAADQTSPLLAADLDRLAAAAFLIGQDEVCHDALTRAFHEHQRLGDVPAALRSAYYHGFALFNAAEYEPAMGWFARAQRLLEESGLDCVERAYLLIPVAIPMTYSDPAAARGLFAQAVEIGSRFADPDIVTVARVGEGRALMRMGEVPQGVALLDEAMVAATADELSPIVVGNIYCVVIEGCFEISDLPRARRWTAALSRWCEAQPDVVPFRGQCLVHRTEIMQMHGSWPDALLEGQRACERLFQHPMLGEAYYQLGQIRRFRGEFAEAEAAFRKANEWGRQPQPGLALLRLAQGDVTSAESSIRRAVDEASVPLVRSKLLAADAEILLAAGKVAEARAAADDLAQLAASIDSRVLGAASSHALGAVLLAEDEPMGALDALRHAWAEWSRLEVPYEAARVRLHIAEACRRLGDNDTAEFELDAARAAFEQLGAAPDLARLIEISGEPAGAAGGLTAREVEVLKLVASGKTNRAIALDLVLSEKTVARHISNIFTKLGISSRSAATAYAYENDLV